MAESHVRVPTGHNLRGRLLYNGSSRAVNNAAALRAYHLDKMFFSSPANTSMKRGEFRGCWCAENIWERLNRVTPTCLVIERFSAGSCCSFGRTFREIIDEQQTKKERNFVSSDRAAEKCLKCFSLNSSKSGDYGPMRS